MIKHLPSVSFADIIFEAKETGDFFRSAIAQFPPFGDGFRAGLLVHLYMARLNLKINQFQ